MKKRFSNLTLIIIIFITAILLVSCDEDTPLPQDSTEAVTSEEALTGEDGHIHDAEVIPELPATCTEEGYTEHTKCRICGTFIDQPVIIKATGHKAEEIPAVPGTCTVEAMSAGEKCSVCDIIIKSPEKLGIVHGEEETVPAVAGTCTILGQSEGKKCKTCGKYTVEPAPTGYGHEEVHTPAVEAACGKYGYTERTACKLCGEVIKERRQVLSTHTFEIIPAVTGSCTEYAKSDAIQCTRCGYYQKRQETYGYRHEYVKVPAIEPGCGTFGLNERSVCKICGKTANLGSGKIYIHPSELHEIASDGKCKKCGYIRTPSEGIEYELVNGKYYRVKSLSEVNDDNLVIPETYNGLPVSEIYENVRYNKSFVSSYIPKTVSKMRYFFFYGELTIDSKNPYFVFEDGLLIEKKTKKLVSYLGDPVNVYIPGDKVKIIGRESFHYMYDVKTLVIGEGVTTIEQLAFFDPPKLESITIPSTLENISRGELPVADKIIGDPIPAAMTELSEYMFSGAKFETLTVPSKIKVISNGAFYMAEIEKIVWKGSISEFGEKAFNAAKFGEFTFPKGLKVIGEMAFKNTNLKVADLPDGLLEIKDGAFFECKELTEIYIPSSVESIGKQVFNGCDSLQKIVVDKNNKNYKMVGDFLVDIRTKTAIAFIFRGSEIVIPQDDLLLNIGDGLFKYERTYPYEKNINSVVIPEGIKSIGYEAFCKTLIKTVVIPSSVEKIGDQAFSGCSELETLVFTDGNLKEIGTSAFAYCGKLFSLEFPDTLEIIGNHAFGNCTSLRSIEFPKSLKHIGKQVFSGCSFLNSVEFSNGLVTIGNNAFEGCLKLYSVVLPNTLKSIGKYAFSGSGLKKINIPKSLSEISPTAFWGTKITHIAVDADSNCFRLSENCLIEVKTKTLFLYLHGTGEFKIPTDGSVQKLGTYSFAGNTSLTEIVIPNCITEIGDGAFASCTSLVGVIIPDSVEKIGVSAFNKCTNLMRISVGSGLKTADEKSFSGCEIIPDFEISDDNPYIYIEDGAIKDKVSGEILMYAYKKYN